MLSDRQLNVLQVIVEDFISTASPVGSRSLSKKGSIPYSSATIRNEMADLEELGFIEKTHTSSGRVPSVQGYRYYVDHLVAPPSLNKEEIAKLKSIFEEKIFQLEKIVERAAKILSEMTNYTAVALGAAVLENQLRKIQLVPLDKSTVVAIIVTDTGHIENKIIHLPKDLDSEKVVNVVAELNDKLEGVPLSKLHKKLREEIGNMLGEHIASYKEVLDLLKDELLATKRERVYYGGKTNILSQPEFNDLEKIKMFMQVIEEDKMYELISNNPEGITVKIGTENKDKALKDCAMITASYSIGNHNIGTIAILGPIRMEYARVISLLTYFSKYFSKVLSNYYLNKNDK